LKRRWGIQVLRYGAGDYAGPHNDHDPEEPDAKDGYLDVHLSFSSPSVAHQWIVHERSRRSQPSEGARRTRAAG
jgi:hypothetical protein